MSQNGRIISKQWICGSRYFINRWRNSKQQWNACGAYMIDRKGTQNQYRKGSNSSKTFYIDASIYTRGQHYQNLSFELNALVSDWDCVEQEGTAEARISNIAVRLGHKDCSQAARCLLTSKVKRAYPFSNCGARNFCWNLTLNWTTNVAELRIPTSSMKWNAWLVIVTAKLGVERHFSIKCFRKNLVLTRGNTWSTQGTERNSCWCILDNNRRY